jgi:hypothetical protein
MVVTSGARDCSVAGSAQLGQRSSYERAWFVPMEIGVGGSEEDMLSSQAFRWLLDFTESSKRSVSPATSVRAQVNRGRAIAQI